MKKTAVITLLVFIGMIGSVHALTMNYEKTPDAAGIKYNFTLTNDLPSMEDIFELYVEIPTDLGNIVLYYSPMGWGDGFGGTDPLSGSGTLPNSAFIEWYAESGSELVSGNSLSGFSFVNTSEIYGDVYYSVNQTDDYSGTLSIPAPVPEPLSLILLGSSLLAVVWKRK